MFSIVLDMYVGPAELIANYDFFFRIIDEPIESCQDLYDALLPHGKQWRTPPQT